MRAALRGVIKDLRRTMPLTDEGRLSDGQLLERFLATRDEAAFAALVRRHGPMVLGVCRRVLRHHHDAEDAFQAAFLVLARKAPAVRRESLANWLYTVAYHAALQARAAGARRRARERQVDEVPHPEVLPAEVQDWRPLLDRELHGLPEKYRAALVLCDLEGKTRKEAARQLRLPEGTLASRLATARRLLAKRLARRGVSLSGGALAVMLTEAAPAAVPAPLVSSTVKAAVLVAAGQVAAVATPAVALMKEVQKAMFLTKLKLSLAVVMVAALLGTGGVVYRAAGQAPKGADRPLTELELLRHEVEILKLQVEVLQSEMRTLKGRGAAEKAAGPGPFAKDAASSMPLQPGAGKALSPDEFSKRPAHSAPNQPVGQELYNRFAGDAGPKGHARNTTDSTVEDELKKLRDATDDPVMRDRLDRVIRRLREQARPKAATPELAK
jgi:RNA polymerase sigma factor (sigma-70 family)